MVRAGPGTGRVPPLRRELEDWRIAAAPKSRFMGCSEGGHGVGVREVDAEDRVKWGQLELVKVSFYGPSAAVKRGGVYIFHILINDPVLLCLQRVFGAYVHCTHFVFIYIFCELVWAGYRSLTG